MDLTAMGPLAQAGDGLALALAVTVFLAGFRHGFDIDHIAAISDIASASPTRRASLWVATTYVLGHALVVFVLGVAAVLAGESIPPSWDAIAGRLIGSSLIWLGLYVLYSLVRHGRDFRMRSRWMLLVAGARRGLAWMSPLREVEIEHDHEHPADGHHHPPHEHAVAALGRTEGEGGALATGTKTKTHSHTHKHVVAMPSDPFTEYDTKTSFAIGMIHGIGAETPTQILLFTTAAGLAGAWGGISLVALFVVGLLGGNTVLAFLSVAGLSAGRRVPLIYLGLASATAFISIWVGGAYLIGGWALGP